MPDIGDLPVADETVADADELAAHNVSKTDGSKDQRLTITKLRADAFLSRANTWTAAQTIVAPSAATVPAVVQGAASQSEALQEWRNNAGTVLARVGPTGELSAVGHQTNNNNVAVRRGFNIGSMSDAATWTVDISNLQAGTAYGFWLRLTTTSTTTSEIAMREWHFGARVASGPTVQAHSPAAPTVSFGAGTWGFALSVPSAGVLRVTITNSTGSTRNYTSALVEAQWGYTVVTASNRPVIG